MLFLSYAHVGGENNAIVSGTLPTDEVNGYSHINLGDLSYVAEDIAELRFYCETSRHTRTVHFKTTAATIKNIAITGDQTGNAAPIWNTGFTPLTGHGGNLPGAATSAVTDPTGGFTEYPFLNPSLFHWGIQGGGTSWECDDFTNDFSQATRHNVWVRMAP